MVLSDFTERLYDSARASWCTVMSGANNYWRFMRNIANSAGNQTGLALPYVNLCNPPIPNPIPFPVQGGRCPGPYRVQYSGRWRNGATNVVTTIPLTTLFACDSPLFAPFSNLADSTFQISPTQLQLQLLFTAASTDGGPVFPRTAGNIIAPSGSVWLDYALTLTRCSGLPDNCSNEIAEPPFVLNWNVDARTFTYVNVTTTFTVPITFTWLDADLNLDGTLNANFQADFTARINIPISVSGTLNTGNGDVTIAVGNDNDFDFDIGGDTVTTINPPPPPPPVSDTDPPPPPPVEGDDPEIPEKQVIRGAIVSVIEFDDSNTTVIAQGNIPDVIAPYAGLVSFLIKVNGISSWTADIPVKNGRQFVPCPWPGGAVNVAFSPRSPGTTAVTAPVYGFPEESLRPARR